MDPYQGPSEPLSLNACLQAKKIAHVIWARGVGGGWGGGTEGWRGVVRGPRTPGNLGGGSPSRIMHLNLLHNASSPQGSCI